MVWLGNLVNMDESGMPLDTKSPKVVARKGDSVSAVGSGDKTQITVAACISAAGFCVPPMVIWDIAPELTIGEIPGTIYGLSSNGWMDQQLFDISISYAMHLQPGQSSCSWMGTPPTIVQTR